MQHVFQTGNLFRMTSRSDMIQAIRVRYQGGFHNHPDQLGDMPRKRSERRRNNSTVESKAIDNTTKIVATARIVGEICSRKPKNICQGKVFCPADPMNITTTTSSNDVMKANRPPDMTPGKINGI